ncbi:MAG TPA: helix-turn-helix transcriptional regulator [Alphaproteobacteria bacterium]
MNIRKLVASNVRRIRQDHVWSQERLALESDIDRTYISGIERGTRNPTITMLQRLADALGVEAMELLRKDQ